MKFFILNIQYLQNLLIKKKKKQKKNILGMWTYKINWPSDPVIYLINLQFVQINHIENNQSFVSAITSTFFEVKHITCL